MIDLISMVTNMVEDGNFWSVIFGTSGTSIASLIGSADANNPLKREFATTRNQT